MGGASRDSAGSGVQKMALELQSVGTLAQSGEWFSEPASGLPENPRMLQGESPTRSPHRVGQDVEPALGVLRVPVDAAVQSVWGLKAIWSETGLCRPQGDRKSTRLNSSHKHRSRMPSSA